MEYEARGLMAFWTDIDDENILEVQKWHNCEHMAERVSIPGFLVGRRYRGVEGHTYLMYYETRDTRVLQSKPYLTALNNSTPWTKKSLTYFKNNIRNIYELVGLTGKKPPTEAPFLYTVCFNIEDSRKVEVIEWFITTYLPKVTKLPEVHRGARGLPQPGRRPGRVPRRRDLLIGDTELDLESQGAAGAAGVHRR